MYFYTLPWGSAMSAKAKQLWVWLHNRFLHLKKHLVFLAAVFIAFWYLVCDWFVFPWRCAPVSCFNLNCFNALLAIDKAHWSWTNAWTNLCQSRLDIILWILALLQIFSFSSSILLLCSLVLILPVSYFIARNCLLVINPLVWSSHFVQ